MYSRLFSTYGGVDTERQGGMFDERETVAWIGIDQYPSFIVSSEFGHRS